MNLTRIFLVTIVSLVLFSSIVHADLEVTHSGFLDDYSLLKPGPKGGIAEEYIKEGVDFKKYQKVMVDHVIFYFKDDAEYKGINADDMKELADEFHKALVENLGDAYPMVDKTAPDVMRVRVAITNMQPNKPVLSGITTVLPVGIVVNITKKVTTDKHAGVGEVSMEIELLDSETNEPIAAGVDRRTGGKLKGVKKWGTADQAFEYWAKRLRKKLDALITK